ncbi:hypothetical protein [Salisaeta longa]|uniref:hypothetical protein n=1 Tax=Salisaeta longa TaxID=503170 RepID=UPI0003B2F913|nr:hypothetical protein [Salisaeta longa]
MVRLLCCLALLLVAGCQSERTDRLKNQLKDAAQAQVNALLDSAEVRLRSELNLTPAQEQALTDALNQAQARLSDAIARAPSWEEAQQNAQQFLAENRDLPPAIAEQLVASRMIEQWLLQGELTPAQRDALSRYTEMLIEQNSAEAAVVANALGQLQGTWSPERIRAAAQQALQTAQQHAPDSAAQHQAVEALRGLSQ